jgi:hypothetical protein
VVTGPESRGGELHTNCSTNRWLAETASVAAELMRPSARDAGSRHDRRMWTREAELEKSPRAVVYRSL